MAITELSDRAPEWVRAARTVAVCGKKESDSRQWREHYGVPMPNVGDVRATHTETPIKTGIVARWYLFDEGRIYYVDDITSEIMETDLGNGEDT